jgi:hypothetical protein
MLIGQCEPEPIGGILARIGAGVFEWFPELEGGRWVFRPICWPGASVAVLEEVAGLLEEVAVLEAKRGSRR